MMLTPSDLSDKNIATPQNKRKLEGTSDSSYQKRQTVPNTAHGVKYQIHKLIQIAITSAWIDGLDFELLTEDTRYGDFDDIVFITDSTVSVMQLKHRSDGGDGVRPSNLVSNLGSNKELMFYKYFDSVYSKLDSMPADVEFQFISNENLKEDLQACIDSKTLKFTDDFFQGKSPLLLVIRNMVIASLCKYSQNLKKIIVNESDLNEKLLAKFIVYFVKAPYCTKKFKDELSKFFNKISDKMKLEEGLEYIIINGLSDHYKQDFISILKNSSPTEASKDFVIYDLAAIDNNLSKYPKVEMFLRKLKLQFGDKHVNKLELEIRDKLKQKFKTTNDAIYHAFFYEFYSWLTSPEARSLNKLRIKGMAEEWYNNYIYLERLCGNTKQKLSYINAKIANARTFEREEEFAVLEKFINGAEKSLMVLHGEAGIGKSSLIKIIFTKITPIDGTWIFVNLKDLFEIAHGQESFNLDSLRTLQLIIIDETEQITNNPQLLEFIQKLTLDCTKTKKKLILLFRTEAYNICKSAFSEDVNGEELYIDGLNIDEVVGSYPILESISRISDDMRNLLRIPFYLNLIVKYHQLFNHAEFDIASQISIVKRYLIQLAIETPAESALTSEHARNTNEKTKRKLVLLSKLAFNSLTQTDFHFTLSPEWYASANSLVQSNILIEAGEKQYIFAHSLYHEWSVFYLIDQEFSIDLEVHNSLQQFLEFPSTYHLRLWFQDHLNSMIPYIYNLSKYKLKLKLLNLMVNLISSIIQLSLTLDQKKALGVGLSYLWHYFKDKKKLQEESARKIFNCLLEIPEHASKEVIECIENVSQNSFYNCFDNYYSLRSRLMHEDIIINTILRSNVTSAKFCRSYPQLAIDLINKTCILPELPSNSYTDNFTKITTRFGLVDDHSEIKWYGSAYCGPFLSILEHHNNKYLTEILLIINKACVNYSKSPCESNDSSFSFTVDEDVIDIDFKTINGTPLKLYGNFYLWSLYRNAGRCVMPHLIQSALMAIERWLLNLAENSNDVELIQALNTIISTSQTVATIAIVASLCIRYPEKLTSYALLLFKIKQFYEWDNRRRINEASLMHYYFLNNDNTSFFEERKEADKFPHRSFDLVYLTLELQIKNILRTEIETILDSYYSDLPPLGKLTDDDKSWKFLLFNMDLRRQSVVNNGSYTYFQTLYVDEMKEFLESKQRPIQEHTDSLKLFADGKKIYEDDKITFSPDDINHCINFYQKTIEQMQDKFKRDTAIIGQCFLACALLYKYNDLLKEQNRQWCYGVISNALKTIPEDHHQHNVCFDGKVPIAETLPKLLARTHKDDKYFIVIKEQISACLTHTSTHVKILTCKAISLHLWKTHANFVTQCIMAMLELAKIEASYIESKFSGSIYDRREEISKIRDALIREQLEINIPELFVTPIFERSIFTDHLHLRDIIDSTLILASGNSLDEVSRNLFKSYLNTAIRFEYNTHFLSTLININVCFFEAILGDFIFALSIDELQLYLNLIILKEDEYNLTEWFLGNIISSYTQHKSIDVEKFWMIWNHTLNTLRSKNISNSTIAKIVFDPFNFYVVLRSYFGPITPNIFYKYIIDATNFVDKISAAFFTQFLLQTEDIITDIDIFTQWLILAAHVPNGSLNQILDVVKRMSHWFKDAQKTIEFFLFVLSKKHLNFIANNENIRNSVLSIIVLLDTNTIVSKIRADIYNRVHSALDVRKSKTDITDDQSISATDEFLDSDSQQKGDPAAETVNHGDPQQAVNLMMTQMNEHSRKRGLETEITADGDLPQHDDKRLFLAGAKQEVGALSLSSSAQTHAYSKAPVIPMTKGLMTSSMFTSHKDKVKHVDKKSSESSSSNIAKLLVAMNALGDDSNLADHGHRKYWYSIGDGFRLLTAIRKAQLVYSKISGEDYITKASGEEHSYYRENREGIFISDPYITENLGESFHDDIKTVTGCHVGDNVKKNHRWESMPRLLILSILTGNHWRVIRIQIEYATRNVSILWDDPYGHEHFDEGLKKRLLPMLEAGIRSLFRSELKIEDYVLKQFNKMLDQQGAGKNGWDCGPIVFSNACDYTRIDISNQQYASAVALNHYTVKLATEDSHENLMTTIRAKHRVQYLEVTSNSTELQERLGFARESIQLQYNRLAAVEYEKTLQDLLNNISSWQPEAISHLFTHLEELRLNREESKRQENYTVEEFKMAYDFINFQYIEANKYSVMKSSNN